MSFKFTTLKVGLLVRSFCAVWNIGLKGGSTFVFSENCTILIANIYPFFFFKCFTVNANTLASICEYVSTCYNSMQLQPLCSRKSIWSLAELVNVLGGALGSIGLPSSISPLGPQGQSLDTGPISGHKSTRTLTLILFMCAQRAALGPFWWGLFKQKADADGSLRGTGRIDSGEESAADRSVLKP